MNNFSIFSELLTLLCGINNRFSCSPPYPLKCFQKFVNLLNCISFDNGHIWYGNKAVMYKVHGDLKGEHSNIISFVIVTFPFSLKLLMLVASKVHFNFLKVLRLLKPLKPILTLDAGNKLASRLKFCFIGFPIEFCSTIGCATFCSNDTTTFSFSYKKLIKVFLLENEPIMVAWLGLRLTF